jgi:UDP-N-acetylglucosamine:LPS N-acetylglucosamine transferase
LAFSHKRRLAFAPDPKMPPSFEVDRCLLMPSFMRQTTRSEARNAEHRKQVVLVIGGSGGLSDHYRDVVAKAGCELRHFETRVPAGARRDVGRVALVVVMVRMVSHALRDQARTLASADAPVVYLRTPSVSALRSAVEQIAA